MCEHPGSQLAAERGFLNLFLRNLADYVRLSITLAKLYFQARMLMVQNYLLNCRLRMWDVVFVYFKIQIFFIRFSYGYPLHDCWPAEESMPPVTRH
jgi:hypothetical protein